MKYFLTLIQSALTFVSSPWVVWLQYGDVRQAESSAWGAGAPRAQRSCRASRYNKGPFGIIKDHLRLDESGDQLLLDKETGEISCFQVTQGQINQSFDNENSRLQRFKLLSLSQSTLGRDFPVFSCHRFLPRQEASVVYSPKFDRTHFAGVATCGSVWTCPICSAKIVSKKANYLEQVINSHPGTLLMITHTLPHSRWDDLQKNLDGFLSAFRSWTSQSVVKKISTFCGLCGSVRALEVTYGKNGWHVHSHCLWFTMLEETDQNLSLISTSLFSVWIREAIRHGFKAPNENGLDVRFASKGAGDYLNKWGAHQELVKGIYKSTNNQTPFGLLQSGKTDLFKTFSRCFSASKSGRKKGVSQLQFSRRFNEYVKTIGLKPFLQTDEELVSDFSEKGLEVISLNKSQFDLLRFNSQLAAFLAAAKFGQDNASQFISNLKGA